MIELRGYIDGKGEKPVAKWFATLDPRAAARVTTALTRIEQGNFSNVKGVGAGVFECRIDFGPGYWVISVRTASASSSLLAADRRNGGPGTLLPRRSGGPITRNAK